MPKMVEFISPIEKKLKKLLENINYKFESDEGKVGVFLEKILYSTPTTFIGEISLRGIINYFHYLDSESIVNMNDKGLIFIYDISNRLSTNLNELSNFECYIGTLDGQVFLIDNYIVCINSKNNFYSNEYNEYLNEQSNKEYDYGELLNSRIIQSEWLDDLCNTPNDELINFKVKTKRIGK